MHLATPKALLAAAYCGERILKSDTMGAVFVDLRSGAVPDEIPELLKAPTAIYLRDYERSRVIVVTTELLQGRRVIVPVRDVGNVLLLETPDLVSGDGLTAWARPRRQVKSGVADSRTPTATAERGSATSAPQRPPAHSGGTVGGHRASPSVVAATLAHRRNKSLSEPLRRTARPGPGQATDRSRRGG